MKSKIVCGLGGVLGLSLSVPLAGGCGGLADTSPEASVSVDALTTSQVPKLLAYRQFSGGSSLRRFVVELASVNGTKLVRLDGCVDENQVRAIFNTYNAPFTDIDFAQHGPEIVAAPGLPCSVSATDGARAFVDRDDKAIAYLQRLDAPGSYWAIPNRCAGLMGHLRLPDRLWALRLGALRDKPEPDANVTTLSCGTELPSDTYQGFRIDRVTDKDTWDEYLMLHRGTTAIFIDTVDGEFYDDTALERLRSAFGVPAQIIARDLPLLNADVLAGKLPIFDVCLDKCGPDWVPGHKLLRNGALECLVGTLNDEGYCTGGTRPKVEQRLAIDGGMSRKLRLGGADISVPVCEGPNQWELRLGLDVSVRTESWLSALNSGYLDGACGNVPQLALTCVDTLPACKFKVPRGADLSQYDLKKEQQTLFNKGECFGDEPTWEISLDGHAFVKTKPLQLRASNVPKTVTKLRITGGIAGATIKALQPACVPTNGNRPQCSEALGVVDVDASTPLNWQLELDIQNVRFEPIVPAPTSGPSNPNAPRIPLPLMRTAIRAKGGNANPLNLRLRNVQIGDGRSAAFFRGIEVSDTQLALFDSDVRAFTYPVHGQNAKVSVVSSDTWGHELASLAQENLTFDDLVGLNSNANGSAMSNFRALSLRGRSQGFVAGMRFRAPIGVQWVASALYPAEDSMLLLDSRFEPAPSYVGEEPLFAEESTLLALQGEGKLRFGRPLAFKLGQVMQCATNLRNSSVSIDAGIKREVRYDDEMACMPLTRALWLPAPEEVDPIPVSPCP